MPSSPIDFDERDDPPSKCAAVFARARQEGFLLTSHCDIDQEGSIEHIRQVIEEIGRTQKWSWGNRTDRLRMPLNDCISCAAQRPMTRRGE